MNENQLLMLNAKDVLLLMVAHSGRSWEDVAAIVGWSPTTLNRMRCATDDYFPKLTSLPRFCMACRSTLILDWIQAQVDHGAVRLQPRPLNHKALLGSMADLLADLAAAVQAAAEAMGDERITEEEARDIIVKLRNLSASVVRIISGLRPIAGAAED